MLAQGETLLLLIPRNYGYELHRLDTVTGEPRWAEAPLLSRQTLDLDRGALDAGAVYLVHDDCLQARSLANGKLLWDARCRDRSTAGKCSERATACWSIRCRRKLAQAAWSGRVLFQCSCATRRMGS